MTEDHIQSILNVRHALASSLGRDLFSDPAFEILLELYAAKLAGERTSLRGLAAETHLPASTIARWITAFGERGLVTTWRPETGPEELFVDLTPQTGAKLNQLADQWIAAFLSI